jgi:hypothetical protein
LWILAAAAVIVVALAIGLTVGLTSRSPSSPTTDMQHQQVYPISEDLLRSFRDGLPMGFVDAINSPNTAYAQANGWLRSHPPLAASDESRLLLRLTQRFALASFFYSHNGSTSWRESDGWLNYSRHECTWFSCSCQEGDPNRTAAVVTRIVLQQNGLAGRFLSPAFELGLLRDGLLALVLPENSVSGPIPSELGLLTKLKYLWLDGNSLSGTLPTELGQIRSLKSLSCRDVETLSGLIPSEIGRLSMLTLVELSENRHSGSLRSELGRLRRLTSLHASNNKALAGKLPTSFDWLKALESLDVSGNILQGTLPSQIASLPKLAYLSVESNSFSGTLPTENRPSNQPCWATSGREQLLWYNTDSSWVVDRAQGHLAALELLFGKTAYIDRSIERNVRFSAFNNSLSGAIPTEVGFLQELSMFSVSKKIHGLGAHPVGGSVTFEYSFR